MAVGAVAGLIVALSRPRGADSSKVACARQECAHAVGIVDVTDRQQREASQKERRASLSYFGDCATEFAVQAVKIAKSATIDAVQIMGGAGFMQDHPAEMWMRNAAAME